MVQDATTDRVVPPNVSATSLRAIFLLPVVTICWILIFDQGLFGGRAVHASSPVPGRVIARH